MKLILYKYVFIVLIRSPITIRNTGVTYNRGVGAAQRGNTMAASQPYPDLPC
jgi:hypothetical protein